MTINQQPTSIRDAHRWADSVVHAWNHERDVSIPPLVLFAEDDEAYRDVLTEKMIRDGFHVASVKNGTEALDFLERSRAEKTDAYRPDLVISDVYMPEMNGLELIEKIRDISPLLPTMLLTGFGDAHVREHATKVGCNQILFKPFDYDAMREHARRLLLTRALDPYDESDKSRDDADNIDPTDLH